MPAPDSLENHLLQFDANWNHPSLEQLRAAIPAKADTAFLLELIRIDARKRLALGQTLDEAFYLQAFPVLQQQPELMPHLRASAFTPMPMGDSVLRALAATTPVLQQISLPAAEGQGTTVSFSPASSTLPEHRYKLEGEIARGGMGAVLRGRDEDLGREIAVKVMLQNHAGKTELLQRFVEEAQIAGQLQHPGITPVYELGRFPDQRPYFTMKLVRGQTLAKLLKDRSDPSSERPRFLKVFEQICQTLAYAHARKVLHRDLKPHNIMVGSFGEVQVMDWGLAKVMTESGVSGTVSARLSETPVASEGSVQTKRSSGYSTDIPNTQAGSVLGTPAYMSPEQARGDIDQLDERADVFGLGAILCEILTGKPPYVGADGMEIFRKAADAELADAHARLQSCGADDELITLARRCLSAHREDRPRDASVLTKELTGYLHSVEDRLKQAELTAAKATTKAEEESKRRQVTFRLAAGILLTLLAGMAGSLWQMRRAMTAEELAKTNENRAIHLAAEEKAAKERSNSRLTQIEKGVELFSGLLSGINPRSEEKEGKPLYEQLRERAEKAADQLKSEAVADPVAEARLQSTLGNTLRELGSYPKAIAVLERAKATLEKDLGADQADTIITLAHLAGAYAAVGRRNEAISLFEKVRDQQQKGNADDPDTLKNLSSLANVYREVGRTADAIQSLEKVRDGIVKKLGAEHQETLICLNNLAVAYSDARRLPESIALYEQVRNAQVKQLGLEHLSTLTTLGNLADTYRAAGRPAEAIPVLKQAQDGLEKKLGADHPETMTNLNILAATYWSLNRLDQSIPLFEDILARRVKKLGRQHPETLVTIANLGVNYKDAGRLVEAMPLMEEAYAAAEKHPTLRWIGTQLQEGYLKSGKLTEAARLTDELVMDARKRLPRDSQQLAGQLALLGLAYIDLKRYHDAEPLIRESLAIREKKESDDWRTFNTKSVLGGVLLIQKKYAEAEPLLLKGYEGMKQREKLIPPQGSKRIPEALDRLIQLYTETSKPDEVKKWQAEKDKLPKPAEKKKP